MQKKQEYQIRHYGTGKKKLKKGTLSSQETVGGAGRSHREKLSLIIEAKSISKNDLGKWLREKGLHTEHITQYEQEIRDLIQNKDQTEKK